MRIQAGALALLLATSSTFENASAFGVNHLHTSTSSFLTRAPLTTPLPPSPRHTTPSPPTSLSMLASASGGIEEMKLLAKEGDYLTTKSSQNPTLFKLTGYAAIPASAILGLVLTPSRRMAASAVGSALTGIAGYIGKNRLDAATEYAALPALARTIVDEGLDDVAMLGERVEDLQEKFGVQDDDFKQICGEAYKRYLVGMVGTPVARTSEMKELRGLREALKMGNLAVGEAHAGAAAVFYRQTCLFTPVEELEDPGHPDRISIDKFLFLSERAFRQGGETQEAFKYEMSRVAKAFDLDLGTSMERVGAIAHPFYERALASTRDKLESGKVSADMLTRARTSLGIDDLTSSDMHLITYAKEMRSLLGKVETGDDDEEEVDMATLTFKSGDKERLSKLQQVLGIEDREADYEIYSETTPLFHAVALTSMNDAIAGTVTPAKAWKQMTVRQGELLLKDQAMKDLVASIMSMALGKPLEETMTFAKVNNEAATYDKLLDALQAKEVCVKVLEESGWEGFAEEFDERFCDPNVEGSATSFLSGQDRLRLYRIMLNRAVRKSESGKELTDEYYAKVQDVQGMLGIKDEETTREMTMSFGPELQKTLQAAMFEIMGDDYTPALLANLKTMKDKVIADYKLSDKIVSSFAPPIYSRAVSIVSDRSPSNIPALESTAQLAALRDLLGMEEEDTYGTHLSVFGSAYRTGILEAMGSTGIIRPEFRAPLDDLRGRLGVSEEAGKGLFLEAAEERMKPMVEWIVLELERTMLTAEQLARKRDKDFGEDYFRSGKGASGTLGLGSEANIMSDCMNLIDFYNENDIAEQRENGTKTVTKKVQEGGEEKTVTEEVPNFETVYPITGLGAKAINSEVSELLYRQFVVGGFMTQGPQATRYEEARGAFGGIVGLTTEKMAEITDSIGGQVYENFIGNAMRTKGSLDQQDMMFLANIQAKLNLAEDASEKMLLQTQKKILSEEANALLGNDDPLPAAVKVFREKCNSMAMDLEQDIGVSKPRLSRMFEAEVSPGLADGSITIESASILSEIQESLGLTPEEAEKMFEGILDKRAKAAMTRIKAELLRGREENCVDIVERVVRYSQFVNGELELDVDEATAWKTFNLYDAMDFDGVESETVEGNKSLLKTALGL